MSGSATRSLSMPRPAILAIAAAVGALIAASIALWAHYGSAVFYEMLLAGLAACF